MKSLTRSRLCWWCNKPLAKISHAEVEIAPNQTVQVHKVCEEATRKYLKPITAQEKARDSK